MSRLNSLVLCQGPDIQLINSLKLRWFGLQHFPEIRNSLSVIEHVVPKWPNNVCLKVWLLWRACAWLLEAEALNMFSPWRWSQLSCRHGIKPPLTQLLTHSVTQLLTQLLTHTDSNPLKLKPPQKTDERVTHCPQTGHMQPFVNDRFHSEFSCLMWHTNGDF